MSIIQGGCGLPVLHPVAYNYLVNGEYLGQITKDEDMPDPQIRQLLEKVIIQCPLYLIPMGAYLFCRLI